MSNNYRDIIRGKEIPTLTNIQNAYDDFTIRCIRQGALELAYYTGRTADPDPTEEEASYTVNYCKLIADTLSSYIAGLPPSFSAGMDDEKGSDIVEMMYAQNLPRVLQTAVSDMVVYARSFIVPYIVADEGKAVPRCAPVSPMDCWVAYDESIDPHPVYGAVHYTERDDSKTIHDYLDVYTKYEITRYHLTGPTDSRAWAEVPGTRRPHGFNDVPIIEFRLNPEGIGSFESVMSLQAGLNQLTSDRIRDKKRFASAVMLARGFSFGDNDEDVEDAMGKIRGNAYIAIPKDADLSYLVKTMDEASVQVLADDIISAIHKISRVPDLSDESFAGNSSGVAMQYKLMGLTNLAQAMEPNFRDGFRKLCSLYSYVLYGNNGANVNDMDIVFRYNIPSDATGEAQTLTNLIASGIISKDTARRNCSYVVDADAEAEMVLKEQEQEGAITEGLMSSQFSLFEENED